MTEAEFWGRVRRRLPPSVFARRIEDNSGNLGTFDTFLAWHGRAAWLELKVAGPNAKPDLRPGQPAFAAALVDAGIPAAYLVGSPRGDVRLIGPGTLGDNWRDHLLARWQDLDVLAILDRLFDGVEDAQQERADRQGWQPEPQFPPLLQRVQPAHRADPRGRGQVYGQAQGR